MSIYSWIRGTWQKRQRKLDVEMLWPICLEKAAGDQERALYAFMIHVKQDPAWKGMDSLEEVRQELGLEEAA